MLESAEVGHVVAKATYTRAEPRLREALLNAQYDLREAGRGPVLLLLSGLAGGGRSEIANKLLEWMDPRFIPVVAFSAPTPEEQARPPAWRYWRALPPRGRLGIFLNAWYTEVLFEHLRGTIGRPELDNELDRLREHEQMLVDEGYTLVKVWLHMRKEDLKRKLRKLDRNPETSWRVTRTHWETYRVYTCRHELWERVLRETSTGAAPWTVVEGSDDRYRDITVGKLVLDALQATAKGRSGVKSVAAPVAPAAIDNTKLLRDLDLAQRMSVKAYDREMLRNQRALAKLTRTKWFAKRGLVLVFEGVDAAGKGGAVRRVTSALDVRQYTIIPIAAPTDEERAHPYLWRFWRRIPPRGGITVFDRSWYGRVLVERVEGYCSEADWLRAYDEINRFEEDLARTGVIVVKFWLHISRKEQLARFRLRQKTSFKRFKITADDWRNRKQWPAYEHAIADMIDRTSTEIAPWTLIEAEDKRFARVKVIRTIVERLGARRKRVS